MRPDILFRALIHSIGSDREKLAKNASNYFSKIVEKNTKSISVRTVRSFVSEQMSRLSAPIFDTFFKNRFFRA